MHAYMLTNIHTYIHTYINKYIHTYIYNWKYLGLPRNISWQLR